MPTDSPAPAPRTGDVLTGLAHSRRMLNLASTVPCRTHDAARGEPCWVLPSTVTGGAHPAYCSKRQERGWRAATTERER